MGLTRDPMATPSILFIKLTLEWEVSVMEAELQQTELYPWPVTPCFFLLGYYLVPIDPLIMPNAGSTGTEVNKAVTS